MGRQYDQWLRVNVPGKYQQVENVRKDISNALAHYKDLRPDSKPFTYNDGSIRNLINLYGTIPVQYKGNTYNIPVKIWIQQPHPQTPPLCFVEPTSSMQVKQGKHVDANGRVYLPYLNEWNSKTHNLVGCIQVMTVVFSQEPPVFAKQAATSPKTQTSPYPIATHMPSPYPPTGYPPVQGPPTTNYQPGFPTTPYPSNVNQPSPYPMYNQQPMGTPSTGYPPYPSYPPSQVSMPSSTPPYQPLVRPDVLNQHTAPDVDESSIKASLLSAASEKLKRRLKDTLAQADHEYQILKQTESELRSGQEKLDSILKRLDREINEADENAMLLRTKIAEIVKELERLNKQDKFNADDAVMATTPVYRQIVLLFAEEQAIEDTIYYLGEALHKNVVDIDTFLKHVRALSRQQFTLRALIQKARKLAGLANVY